MGEFLATDIYHVVRSRSTDNKVSSNEDYTCMLDWKNLDWETDQFVLQKPVIVDRIMRMISQDGLYLDLARPSHSDRSLGGAFTEHEHTGQKLDSIARRDGIDDIGLSINAYQPAALCFCHRAPKHSRSLAHSPPLSVPLLPRPIATPQVASPRIPRSLLQFQREGSHRGGGKGFQRVYKLRR